jgi:hypothetical protein
VKTDESVHDAVVPASRRLLVSLLWGLTQVVTVFILFFAGGVAVGYLKPAAVPLGLGAGTVAGLYVCHQARGWLQQARLRGLRAHGVSARTTACWLESEWFPSPRGGGVTKYVAHVGWRDPGTGAVWQGERRYQFYGRGPRQLEAAFVDGNQVELHYPANRPERFVIDLPFAPTMADVLG